MELTIAQLRSLVAVADSGGFTRGAEALRVSQPALSRSVRSVERQLSMPLFRRTGRAVEVTERGRDVIEVARRMVRQFDADTDRIMLTAKRAHKELRIAALPSVIGTVLPQVLERFRSAYPHVVVSLMSGLADEVARLVDQGTADVGVADASSSGSTLVFAPLFDEGVRCVLPPDHSLTVKSSVTWDRLSRERFVSFPSHSSIFKLVHAAFEEQGAQPSSVIDCYDVASAAGIVASGLGVTAVPELVLPLMSFAEVVNRPLSRPVLRREIGLLTKAAREDTAAARAFVACANECLPVDLGALPGASLPG